VPKRNIVVVGASAGGVEALQTLVKSLPGDFPGSIFIVLHISPDSPSLLPAILERAGPLVATHPLDGAPILHGHIYIAPADHHMLIERDNIRIVRGPKENRHRPAIDPLFRSAALAYGPQVIGVVLTGSLDDGTAGLINVKQRGGLAIIQDPASALCGDMPRSALRYTPHPDFILPLDEIGPKLNELVRQSIPAEAASRPMERLKQDVEVSEMQQSILDQNTHPGRPSPFACPECSGVLWERQEGELLHFRCRVGHAYTADNLQVEQTLAVESALWAALRSLEENASLNMRLSERATERKQTVIAERFQEQADSKKHQASVLRNLLMLGHSKN